MGRPTRIDSTPKRAWFHSDFTRPLKYSHRPIIVAQIDVVASVERLLACIRKSDIFRAITAIIVDAVHGKPGPRQWLNIGDKVGDAAPARANADATPPVVRIGGGPWVFAPSRHCGPNGEKWVFGQPMRFDACAGDFPRSTAARGRIPSPHPKPENNLLHPAVTSAKEPSVAISGCIYEIDDGQTAKFLAVDVGVRASFAHAEIYLGSTQKARNDS